MNKLVYVWFAVKTLFCNCQSEQRLNGFEKVRSHYKISKIGKLPDIVNESSGLARGKDADTFWTHNDSGGKAELYLINANRQLVQKESVPIAANKDWEDLAQDDQGHLYIGDFGHNGVARKSWDIYRFDPEHAETSKITFTYSGTAPNVDPKFPSFDCEAFFYLKNSLYLFSKNWGNNKMVKLYKLPAEPGEHTAEPIDSIRINAPVTSADISPDGKTFALLTYGKVLLFDLADGQVNFSKPAGCFRFSRMQTEAIVFTNNKDLLITNEQGRVYRVTYK